MIGRGGPSSCPERRLVDRHFAVRIAPAEELALRAHLPGCARCRRYYGRQLLLADLVPGRPAYAERLAAGLGIAAGPGAFAGRAERTRAPRPVRRALVFAAAAAGLALVALGRLHGPADREFGVRGWSGAEPGAALEVYRVAADGSTQPAAGWMAAGDELAFAYRNPDGFARLVVFGVDELGAIYWFHPGWTDPGSDPGAVPVQAGLGPFELPEAIHHEVRGARLRIVALFTNDRPTVRALEEAWKTARPDPAGTVRVETALEVRR